MAVNGNGHIPTDLAGEAVHSPEQCYADWTFRPYPSRNNSFSPDRDSLRNTTKFISLDPTEPQAPTRLGIPYPEELLDAKDTKVHPTLSRGDENASIRFIGNATTIISFGGVRILTDPNFTPGQQYIEIVPEVASRRCFSPDMTIGMLPHIDAALLSLYARDHIDYGTEHLLRRDLPIITTEHAKKKICNPTEGDGFTNVTDLQPWESCFMNINVDEGMIRRMMLTKVPSIRVIAMPAKHVHPGPGIVPVEIQNMVPPANGWMVELGYGHAGNFQCGYRIYITGDTVPIEEIKEIPRRFRDEPIDLMLIHTGAKTISTRNNVPIARVTMTSQEGVDMIKLIWPEITIPIHTDDFDVFMAPQCEFVREARAANLNGNRVVALAKGEDYRFTVRGR